MTEMSNKPCREVWKSNRNSEICLMEYILTKFPIIAIDTEFPGCLRQTSQNATEEERYGNMSFNVDRTKLIQLGLTFLDKDGKVGGTWEVNFSDFEETEDARNEKSIEFLKRNGLDLKKIREQGIGIKGFFCELFYMVKQSRNKVTWVTFHGSYDIAYLLKCKTGESLPVTSEMFSKEVAKILGSVYDLKVMAGLNEVGLSSRLGLESLAHEFGLTRLGTAHHAGSDSELTARVFAKMAKICHNLRESEGFVYGLGYRIISESYCGNSHRLKKKLQIPDVMMTRCYIPPPLPQPVFMFPRPMFVSCFPPFGGFVSLERVPMS